MSKGAGAEGAAPAILKGMNTMRMLKGSGFRTVRCYATVLSLSMLTGTATAIAQNYGPPPQPGYGQGYNGGGWDTVPPEFRAAQQRGFHDGIEGARKDFQNHRPPNVNNRDEYRNPKYIPGPDRRDYRFGFQRGYDVAVRHMYGPGPR